PLGPLSPDGPLGPLGPLSPDGPLGPLPPDGPLGPLGPLAPFGPLGPDGPPMLGPGPPVPTSATCNASCRGSALLKKMKRFASTVVLATGENMIAVKLTS